MGPAKRDALVVETLPLVRFLAGSVQTRVTQISRDDLASAGAEALVKAADDYKVDLGVPFSDYARLRVAWAIKDEQRRMDWAPQKVRAAAKDAVQTREMLCAELGRTPTSAEIALKLDRSPAAVTQSLADAARVLTDLDQGGAFDVASAAALPEDVVAFDEERAILEVAIESLPERKRQIIRDHYFEERPIKEIADEMGVSSAAISQQRAEAVRMLRTAMDHHYPDEHRDEPAVAPETSSSGLEKYFERIARSGKQMARALVARALDS